MRGGLRLRGSPALLGATGELIEFSGGEGWAMIRGEYWKVRGANDLQPGRRVRVTGAVRTPRSIPHRQGMTVLDAVLEAGGVNDFASPNRSRLYRKVKDKTEVFEIDLGDILKKGRLETNYPLKPGDVVTVPERLF